MNVMLVYHDHREDGIFGELIIDDKHFCVTLSHAYEQTDGTYEPIVMPGTYTCVRGANHHLEDPKHPGGYVTIETFEITGVAGHHGLLFHPGNWNRDSKGCTLLGESIQDSADGKMIVKSQITFKAFMAKMEGIDTFELEVVDND